MAKTALQLTNEDMAVYKSTAQQQKERERQELLRQTQRAQILAQQAAKLLKEQFGAKRVILFGSLARRDFFRQRSDIDLAVEGIKSQYFWQAWASLDSLGREFEIDLVDVETAPHNLLLEIEREGIEL